MQPRIASTYRFCVTVFGAIFLPRCRQTTSSNTSRMSAAWSRRPRLHRSCPGRSGDRPRRASTSSSSTARASPTCSGAPSSVSLLPRRAMLHCAAREASRGRRPRRPRARPPPRSRPRAPAARGLSLGASRRCRPGLRVNGCRDRTSRSKRLRSSTTRGAASARRSLPGSPRTAAEAAARADRLARRRRRPPRRRTRASLCERARAGHARAAPVRCRRPPRPGPSRQRPRLVGPTARDTPRVTTLGYDS